MKNRLKKEIKKTTVALAASLVLVYAFTALQLDGLPLSAVPKADAYRVLCDAFTIPGLLLLAIAFLMLLSNHGALDGVGYLALNAIRFLIPVGGTRMERYHDYLERRRAHRSKGYGFLFVVALILIACAAAFLILFYSVWNK